MFYRRLSNNSITSIKVAPSRRLPGVEFAISQTEESGVFGTVMDAILSYQDCAKMKEWLLWLLNTSSTKEHQQSYRDIRTEDRWLHIFQFENTYNGFIIAIDKTPRYDLDREERESADKHLLHSRFWLPLKYAPKIIEELEKVLGKEEE